MTYDMNQAEIDALNYDDYVWAQRQRVEEEAQAAYHQEMERERFEADYWEWVWEQMEDGESINDLTREDYANYLVAEAEQRAEDALWARGC